VSDIFVSYASADRDRARAVAQALTEHGWSVWWDRTIPPGKQFDEVIEEALDAARCVER
jgi:TIR domain-containing protein